MMNPRILVVEDDQALLTFLVNTIQHWGYLADGAVSGPEAIRLVTANCPQIVISDLVMPGMDGLELLRLIRAVRDDCVMFFILITGYGTVDAAVDAVIQGANEVLLKPLDLDRLRGLLAKYTLGVK